MTNSTPILLASIIVCIIIVIRHYYVSLSILTMCALFLYMRRRADTSFGVDNDGRVYFTERNGTERNGTQGYFTLRTSVITERLI